MSQLDRRLDRILARPWVAGPLMLALLVLADTLGGPR